MAPHYRGREHEPLGPAQVFRSAIEETGCLNFKEGLSAIKRGEGHGSITARDQRQVLGSANIDDDCKKIKRDSNANRWDYVLGYDCSNEAVAFFVEVHGAGSHNVGEMEKKLDWLKEFLERQSNEALRRLKREYHWVRHGRFNIPRHVPQYKRLEYLRSRRRLNGPVEHLELS